MLLQRCRAFMNLTEVLDNRVVQSGSHCIIDIRIEYDEGFKYI